MKRTHAGLCAFIVAGMLAFAVSAAAQDTDIHRLYLREASPRIGLDNPPQPGRYYLLPPPTDTPGSCGQSWTSGGFDLLGPLSTWDDSTAPTWDVPPVWLPITVDLTDYANRAVAIAFSFSTLSENNHHEGVFVDAIRVGPLADNSSFFSNGANLGQEGGMLAFNGQHNPRWRVTNRRAYDGVQSWWFGNDAGTYERVPDPSPGDPCLDGPSSGVLMTPAIKLGAHPVLTFQTLFSTESVSLWPSHDFFHVYLLVDTDEDGLLDVWEMQGVDTDLDGHPEFTLTGADPLRKDIYVEIDYMEDASHSDGPLPGAIPEVVAAFDRMPVANPGGSRDGIALHVEVGDAVPHFGTISVVPGFYSIKDWFFDHRKQCCYHYSVWAHDQPHPPGRGGRLTTGKAERNGNDILLSLGTYLQRYPQAAEGTQAGTFMHELGHNLGLRHGGADDVNEKPQYFSVMNYAYGSAGELPGGVLRYSYEDLGELDETRLFDLDPVGVGSGFEGSILRYNCPGNGYAQGVVGSPVDWNCNRRFDLGPLCQDVTADTEPACNLARNPRPYLPLRGHDDLTTLDLTFGDGSQLDDFQHDGWVPAEDELSEAYARTLAGDPDADTTPPQVTAAEDRTGPNGRPAVLVEVSDIDSGLRRLEVQGANVDPVSLRSAELPDDSVSLLVESRDESLPVFVLTVSDWAHNTVTRAFGVSLDVVPPSCALATRGTDDEGRLRLDIGIRDGGALNGAAPSLVNATLTGQRKVGRGAAVLSFSPTDPAQPMSVGLTVRDGNGNSTSCAFLDSSTPIDTDGDGVGDIVDNCPLQANAGQEDTDADGVGDACLAVSVVSVEGATEAEVESALVAADLRLGTVTHIHSAEVPAGSVIAQDSVAGGTVAEGTTVNLAVSLGPVMRTVPSVVGLAQSAAESALRSANLSVGHVATVHDATAPAGTVISQGIAPGVSVPEGSPVDLVVSLGRRIVVVPDVTGLVQSEAAAALAGANLAAGVVTTAHSVTVPAGRVLGQSPVAGSSAVEGSHVDLVISLGPRIVTVPDVTGLAQAAATASLHAADLAVGTVVTVHSATVPAGAVISQSPASGATVNEGSAVDLEVSLGPVLVWVPDLTGLTEADATAALSAAHLTIGAITVTDSAVPPGRVDSQAPQSGVRIAEGSPVDLWISRGRVLLSIQKTGPASVQGGQEFTYVISYANNGTRDASDVVVRDTVPFGVSFRSASAGGAYDTWMSTVTWPIGPLPAGASGEVRFNAAAFCYVTNVVNADYLVASAETLMRTGSSVLTHVTPAPSDPVTLTIASVPDRLPLRSGDHVTHTLRLTNTVGLPRASLRFTLGAGPAMDFDAVIADGGGSIRRIHPTDTWEWTGSLAPNATVEVVVTTRVEDTIPATSDETSLNWGQPVWVATGCSTTVGTGDVPPLMPLIRPIRASLGVTALGGPRTIPAPSADGPYQLVRPGVPLELRLMLANQLDADEPDVHVRLPLPAGVEAAGDPPFVAPSDAGAAYDPTTRTVTWQGAIAAGQTRTVTLRAQLLPSAGCRTTPSLRGTTTGAGDDIGSTLTLFIVPEPPTEPYLVGMDHSLRMGVWTFRPGVDAAPQTLLCPTGESLQAVGQTPWGDLYVSGLPSFRLNAARLELEFFPRDSYSDVAIDATAAPPTAIFITDGRVWRMGRTGATSTILEDASLGLRQLAVDPEGRIFGLDGGLVRIDPRGGTPLPAGAMERISVPITLPFASQLGTPFGQGPSHVGLDADGNYLVTVRSLFAQYDGFPTPRFYHFVYSLAAVDRSTLAVTLVADTVAAASQDRFGNAAPPPAVLHPLLTLDASSVSMAVGTTGEVYYGSRPASLSVLRRTPSLTGERLFANPGRSSDAPDLEWVVPYAPVNSPPALATIGDQALTEGATAIVTVTAADPDGDPLVMSASGLPPFATLVDHGDSTATLTLSPGLGTAGSYPGATITVFDGAASDTETFAITVTPSNRSPLAGPGGPYEIFEGGVLHLDGSASTDPDHDPVSGSWTFRGETLAGLAVDVPVDDDFAGEAELTVSDGRGGGAIARALVVVRNVAPSADAGPDRTTYWGRPIAFSGSATDPGPADRTAGLQSTWTFGDGTSASGLATTHAYAAAGAYDATLGVRDKDGGAGQDAVRVLVQKRPTRLVYTGPVSTVFGAATMLFARLRDTIDPGTARLGGRTVRFVIGGSTLNASTGVDGVAAVEMPPGLATGSMALHLDCGEDADYLGDSADATLQVANTPGHVTAAGWNALGGGGGFNVHSDGASVSGELFFQTRRSTIKAKITALGISPDRHRAWVAGVGNDGRRLLAYVEDNGTGPTDVFKVWVDGAAWNGDGRLSGGNVQIQGASCARAPR